MFLILCTTVRCVAECIMIYRWHNHSVTLHIRFTSHILSISRDTGIGEMGVRDVTGSCAEGHIDWRNPYGAIRVSLKPSPLPSNYKNVSFEACFLASAHYTTVKFSLDNPSIGLKPLIVLTPDSAQMTSELCFRSEGDPVVLFVESELDSQSAAMGLVQIEYDIKRLPRPDQRQHYGMLIIL